MQTAELPPPSQVLSAVDQWHLSQWLVKSGQSVRHRQHLAILKSTSGASEHLIAPRSGTLASIHVTTGSPVNANTPTLAKLSFCPHSVVFKGVCAVCGLVPDVDSDTITSRLPVAYNSSSLTVTRAEAESVASVTARKLFDARRLSLVLDLDHTLLHATAEDVIADALAHSPSDVDTSSVNSFILESTQDSTRARMFVKLRPNLKKFLARVSRKFQLHIYTMGSRPYAARIASLIDPEKRLFSGRITSREDFIEGSLNQKSIQRLFPCDDSMVLIVDDREDVWTAANGLEFMPNLIRAQPYTFWNDLSDQDRRKLYNNFALHPPPPVDMSDPYASPVHPHTPVASNTKPLNSERPNCNGAPNKERCASSVPAIKGYPGCATVAEPQHSQSSKRIESKSSSQQNSPAEGSEKACEVRDILRGWMEADARPEKSGHLLRLADVLEECHARFFRACNAYRNGGVNNGGHQGGSNFEVPADVKNIMSEMRSEVLDGCHLAFTCVIPTGADPASIPIWNLALRLGAHCSSEFVNGETTHLVARSTNMPPTQKMKEVLKSGAAYIVTTKWLEDSAMSFKRLSEFQYTVECLTNRYANKDEYREAVEGRFAQESIIGKRLVGEGKLGVEVPSSKRRKSESRGGAFGSLQPTVGTSSLGVTIDELDAAMDDAFMD